MQPYDVLNYKALYESMVQRTSRERDREELNWRTFSGLYHGQWSPAALTQLFEEGRPPSTYNFLFGKVLTLVGATLTEGVEGKYTSVGGYSNDWALLIEELAYRDKDLHNWSHAQRLMWLSGQIYRGVLELRKDYDIERDPLGSLKWVAIPPSQIITDADWQSDKEDDCKVMLRHMFLTPEDIKLTYKKKNDEIDFLIAERKRMLGRINDSESAMNEADKLFDRRAEYHDQRGDLYKVIEFSELVTEDVNVLFDMKDGKKIENIHPEAMEALRRLRGSDLKDLRVTRKINKIKTICPGLSNMYELEDGNNPIQIGSHTKIIWSTYNLWGTHQTPVDLGMDPQQNYNKRQSSITHFQMTAANGSLIVKRGTFRNDQMKILKKFKGKPGTIIESEDPIDASTIAAVPRGQFPNDLLIQRDNDRKTIDDILSVTPAMEGISERSGESSSLFEKKRAQALLSNELVSQSIDDKYRQMADMYLRAAKLCYAGPQREIYGRNGMMVVLNERTPQGIATNIKELDRKKIRIIIGHHGTSVKRDRFARYMEMFQRVADPAIGSHMLVSAIKTIDGIPQDEQEALLRDAALTQEVVRLRAESEKLQLLLGIANSQNQLQQMTTAQAQMPGQPGIMPPQGGPSPMEKSPAAGGGFSFEGKAINPQGGIPFDLRKGEQLAK